MDVTFRAEIVKRTRDEPSITGGGYLKLKLSQDNAQILLNKMKSYDGRELKVTMSDSDNWTDSMNRLFHALIRDIMAHDAVQYWQLLGRAPSGFDEIKAWCKVQFGGAEVKIVGNLSFIKSWKDFGKKQALQTIDNLLLYMSDKGIDIDSHKLEADSLVRR